jgi:hypothetical protein
MVELKEWPDFDFREFATIATTDSRGFVEEGTLNAGF